jgi:hypothetical protein
VTTSPEDPPPWLEGPEITQSQLDFLTLRHSQEDYERMLKVLNEYKILEVIADPVAETKPIEEE